MHVLIVALAGAGVSATFARAARRYAVADRLRSGSGATRRPLPPWLAVRVARALDAAALDVTPERALSTWTWIVTVAGVVGVAFAGPQSGVGVALATGVGVPVVVLAMHERRARQVAAAVPETLERVASELRAGGTVATAIGSGAAGEGSLAADLERVETRMRLGASVTDALREWARERAPVAGVGAAAGALALCSSVGGRSADALDGMATSLRDRLAVAAEARALSAQARMSAFVVGGAPIAYVAWSAIVDPHSLHVLTGTPFGQLCLALGLALEVLGAMWMRRIVRNGSGW